MQPLFAVLENYVEIGPVVKPVYLCRLKGQKYSGKALFAIILIKKILLVLMNLKSFTLCSAIWIERSNQEAYLQLTGKDYNSANLAPIPAIVATLEYVKNRAYICSGRTSL